MSETAKLLPRTWATRIRASLEQLAANSFTVLCVLLCTNALTLPYHGLFHDARLYAAQISEKVDPNFLKGDLYLAYGSQDSYSIFTLIMLPLVWLLGLHVAFFLVYLVSKVLFFWALLRIVFVLVPDRAAALLALIYLAMAPLPFGGNEVFHLNEAFLTPRIASCALVLFGLERAIAGRLGVSVILLGLGLLVHPLMGFGGLLALAIWWLLDHLSRRTIWVLSAVCVLVAALVVPIEPLGRRVFGHMDEEWRSIYLGPCFFIDPAVWFWGDWVRIILAVGVMAWMIWERKSVPNLLWALLITAGLGMAGTLVAVHSHYRLLLQASPYRTMWMVELLGIPLAFGLAASLSSQSAPISLLPRSSQRAPISLLPRSSQSAPISLRSGWQSGRPLSGLLALVLLFLFTTDWNGNPFPPILVFAVLLPICIIHERGLARSPQIGDWLERSAIMAFLIALPLLLLYTIMAIIFMLWTPSQINVDFSPLNIFVSLHTFSFKLPLICLLAGFFCLAAGLLTASRLQIALLMLAFSVQAGVTALDQWDTYRLAYYAWEPHGQFVARFMQQRSAEKGRTVTVYWTTTLAHIWFRSHAKSYFNSVQMSGCGFNRGTAIEGRRRADLVRRFEIEILRRVGLPEDWRKALEKFYDVPKDEKPTEEDLCALSQDPELDYVVLEKPPPVGLNGESPDWWQSLERLSCAHDRVYYIFDCEALRSPARP